MDPDLAPLWGAASSHQLPPRVSSGSSSPDETVQGVKPSGGDKGKTDKEKKNPGKDNKKGKPDKGKKDKGKKRKKDDDEDDDPDQENEPLADGDDDDDDNDFGLDGLSDILKESGGKNKGRAGKPTPTKKPSTRDTKKRPASKKEHEAFQITSVYPALMFVVRLKWGTFFFYLIQTLT